MSEESQGQSPLARAMQEVFESREVLSEEAAHVCMHITHEGDPPAGRLMFERAFGTYLLMRDALNFTDLKKLDDLGRAIFNFENALHHLWLVENILAEESAVAWVAIKNPSNGLPPRSLRRERQTLLLALSPECTSHGLSLRFTLTAHRRILVEREDLMLRPAAEDRAFGVYFFPSPMEEGEDAPPPIKGPFGLQIEFFLDKDRALAWLAPRS